MMWVHSMSYMIAAVKTTQKIESGRKKIENKQEPMPKFGDLLG